MSAMLVATVDSIAPTAGQFVWALAALVLFGAGLALVWMGYRGGRVTYRRTGRILAAAGLVIDLGLVVYRSMLWTWNLPDRQQL